MSKQKYTKVSDILTHHSCPISKLSKKCQKLNMISQHLTQCLPDGLKNYVKVSNYYQGILELSTTNTATATQLRHLSTRIMNHLSKALPNERFLSIQCKIAKSQPQSSKIVKTKLKATPISHRSSNAIKKFSDEIKDERLASALNRLANQASSK